MYHKNTGLILMKQKQTKTESETKKEAGWSVSESIMLELDLILSVINGYIDPDSFVKEPKECTA